MPNSIFEAMKAATCSIESSSGKGTGYLISQDRVVTCHHVVKGLPVGQKVTVPLPDPAPSPASVTDTSSDAYDVAVLQLTAPAPEITPLRFGKVSERKLTWEGY